MKLALTIAAIVALHLTLIVKPAFAQTPRVLLMPAVLITAKAKPVSRCYTRALESVSRGNVRVCPPAGQVK